MRNEADMTCTTARLLIAIAISILTAECGLYVPEKDPFRSDTPDPAPPYHTQQANYENVIVSHVVCEIANGLAQAQSSFALPWLGSSKWGTSATITITAQEQSGLSPGISIINPLRNVISTFPTGGNVVSTQSFALNIGVSGSANATRTETIQFTFLNSALVKFGQDHPICTQFQKGIMVDGDLKIRHFIYDKAEIAALGNASLFNGRPYNPAIAWQYPIYNTFTEEITFVATLAGNITPVWKLAHLAANSNANLAAAQRIYTNDLVITVGPIGTPPSDTAPAALSTSAQNQHNARVQGSATATSISSIPAQAVTP
jgi:hypothetical protein